MELICNRESASSMPGWFLSFCVLGKGILRQFPLLIVAILVVQTHCTSSGGSFEVGPNTINFRMNAKDVFLDRRIKSWVQCPSAMTPQRSTSFFESLVSFYAFIRLY